MLKKQEDPSSEPQHLIKATVAWIYDPVLRTRDRRMKADRLVPCVACRFSEKPASQNKAGSDQGRFQADLRS